MTLFLIIPRTENTLELIVESRPSKFSVRLKDTDLQRLKAEIKNYEDGIYSVDNND